MTHPLSHLQPGVVWDYFYQLTQIPRPSHHEEQIQNFMVNFGQSLGLDTSKDSVGNIIIKKPATAGYEHSPGIILQSHLDMVPQADSNSRHQFETDPIEAYIDGDWVTAKGTTLGADNGIGVAAIMAVLSDTTIEHGPIEALLTSTEETGMIGALNLQPDVLTGDILLNLDSEDEGLLFISCAGGIDGTFTLPVRRQPRDKEFEVLQLTVSGLRGGHSGIDIIRQRANANKVLARLLTQLDQRCHFQLLAFNGGDLRNAIPRQAQAIIALSPTDRNTVCELTDVFKTALEKEYHGVENNLNIAIDISDNNELKALSAADKTKLLNTVNACPNGVFRMSREMKNLVETSSNLAIVSSEGEQVIFGCLLRSSLDSARDELAMQISAVFELAGAHCQFSGTYPGWQPNPNSTILQIMKETGKSLFGKTPECFGIHAGLECGILGGIYPNWDMVSFGPTIRAPHSPDEKVNIASVKGFYEWLLATLKAVK